MTISFLFNGIATSLKPEFFLLKSSYKNPKKFGPHRPIKGWNNVSNKKINSPGTRLFWNEFKKIYIICVNLAIKI